jgi:hypothetical protein
MGSFLEELGECNALHPLASIETKPLPHGFVPGQPAHQHRKEKADVAHRPRPPKILMKRKNLRQQ